MNKLCTAFRLVSLAFAMIVTGSLLAAVDRLADHERAEVAA